MPSFHENKIIEQLYREMFSKLYIYAVSLLNDSSLAEEAVQDTFRIACTKANSFLKSPNPQGWLFNTLKNVIKNIKKAQAKLNVLFDALFAVEMNSSADPELDFRITYSELLGSEDFKLLELIVLNKYTILEASQELGISLEACKKRLHRAKKKLAKILEKEVN